MNIKQRTKDLMLVPLAEKPTLKDIEEALGDVHRDGAKRMREPILAFHGGSQHFGDEFACGGHPSDETCKACELKAAIDILDLDSVLETPPATDQRDLHQRRTDP